MIKSECHHDYSNQYSYQISGYTDSSDFFKIFDSKKVILVEESRK